MVLATELGDLRRFSSPRQLMAAVILHAWKCQHRLYSLFHRLAVKKPGQVAVTASARELVGFLWAVLRDIDGSQLQEVSAAA